MGGYQLMVAGDVVRSRFRNSFEKPEPLVPNAVHEYTVDLHWSHHCFRKGHRIMVQVQSSWFPLIDRNPQTYVENIFKARDSDFQVARQRVFHAPRFPSHVTLPVLTEEGKEP
jgi:predicted acyl esterase